MSASLWNRIHKWVTAASIISTVNGLLMLWGNDVVFPDDCIKILRCRPFKFSARSCNRWSDDRVILCGYAAHVFPPFGGQGIASGFRDAVSLAWRLATLCRPEAREPNFHQRVLKACYEERKQQLEKSLATTIENGKFVTESNPLKILARRIYFKLIRFVPSWRQNLSLERRREGMIRYEYSQGLPFIPRYNGGLCLSQVYCKPIGSSTEEVFFTDDIIFNPKKNGLFQLLVYLKSPAEIQSAGTIAENVEDMSTGEIQACEMTILAEDLECKIGENKRDNAFRLASSDEFASSSLCRSRPNPISFDPFCLGKQLKGMRFVILRPDRFIFAACHNKEDLRKVCDTLHSYLQEGL